MAVVSWKGSLLQALARPMGWTHAQLTLELFSSIYLGGVSENSSDLAPSQNNIPLEGKNAGWIPVVIYSLFIWWNPGSLFQRNIQQTEAETEQNLSDTKVHVKSHLLYGVIMESMDGFGPCVSENCSSEMGALMKTVRMIVV